MAKSTEKTRAACAKWRRNNPERVIELRKKWRTENPNRSRMDSANKRARRRQWLLSLKTACITCGEADIRCLEFHHRDPATKLFGVMAKTGIGLERLQTEVEKCDVLCANCHSKLTLGDRNA